MAWNLAGFNPIPRERVPEFARVIADLDPEVLALAEVNPDFVAGEIVAEMNELGVCYQRKLLEQDANQNLALLHKCDVEVRNPRFIPNSDLGNTGLRKALVVDVKLGQFDFILINVHLKAGRSSSDRSTRDDQCEILASFIQLATSGAEKDVLVVGDYNMIPGDDDSNFDEMSPTGFLRFLTSELPAGSFSHISGSGSPGNLLDGFGISGAHTGEYVGQTLQIFPVHETLGLTLGQFRSKVSDHLPVLARFRILEDDD